MSFGLCKDGTKYENSFHLPYVAYNGDLSSARELRLPDSDQE